MTEPGPEAGGALRTTLDRGDMAGAIAGLPAQLRGAAERLPSIPVPTGGPWDAVIVLGMGGSAIGADVVRAAFADRARSPIVVSREPTLPAWVDRSTLVIASSHSGGTAETLAATTTAVERGATLVAVTTGGALAELGQRSGQVVEMPAGGQPRAALGWSVGLVLGVLAAAGVVDHDVAVAELLAAADAYRSGTDRYGPAVPGDENPAARLARALESRIAVVVGGGHLAPVARRWKTQLNENAKTWAAWDELPELAHNTLVALDAPDAVRSAVHVVILHGTEDAAATARRRAVVEEIAASGTSHIEVALEPGPALAEAFAGLTLGDWVSYHLAIALGRDPTPVDAIVRYKTRLAGS